MDTNLKAVSSYQQDQEILDSRGINMTVEEVAGLSTSRYAERVQALHLSDEDCAFLKGLRRRIKNRMASQNSRRRSVENLRRLTRELRVVRACKGDAVTERQALLEQRRNLLERCRSLRELLEMVLKERSDPSRIPNLDVTVPRPKPTKTQPKESQKLIELKKNALQLENEKIEYKIDKLVENSVNFIYKNEVKKENDAQNLIIEKKFAESPSDESMETDTEQSQTQEQRKITAKTIFFNDFLTESKQNGKYKFEIPVLSSQNTELTKRLNQKTVLNGYNKSINQFIDQKFSDHINGVESTKKVIAKTVFLNGAVDIHGGIKDVPEINGVLNLSVKNGRRHHGRKQSAPRKIAYAFCESEDAVLDLQVHD